jgi:prepilin peptidase CpaA
MATVDLLTMGTTAPQAAWLLIAALPIGLYVAWSDMKTMKIPNRAVFALVAGFAVLGLIAFRDQLDNYLWRWSHLVVVLILGMLLNIVRLVGAGDAKFAAAAAPFIAASDWRLLVLTFAVCLLAAWVTHRLVKYSPLRRLVPDWESWTTGKRFPMGLALGATLVAYLTLAITTA